MASRDETGTFLERLRQARAASAVRITWKADDEIAEIGWSRRDALDQLAALTEEDLLRTEPANHADFETIWVFCPLAPELDRHLWIRLAEREHHTLLVSFHLAEGDPWT
ncbi:MAG: type II toxin-antitoxin system MqsR family toxin [Deltaproteobacteria bacterium]|nr:type II toxin-antitoxin system MqsR family toxin [Deltaproteobacteria bacterium]